MQSVDLKKRRRAVKIANAVNSIEGVPVSKEVKLIQARFAKGVARPAARHVFSDKSRQSRHRAIARPRYG